MRAPRYLEIAAKLRRAIASGAVKIGGQLPTEHELCAEHGVSRHTARAALGVIEDEGLIERRPGLGTRVISKGAAPAFHQPLGGLDELLQYAREARLEITHTENVALTAGEARRFGAAKGSRWLRLDGLRRANGTPIAATTILIAEAIGAAPADFMRTRRAVAETIERKYGVAPAEIRQTIAAGALSAEDAARLSAQKSAPALTALRRYHDAGGRLYIVSDTRHPADRFVYEMSFRRSPR